MTEISKVLPDCDKLQVWLDENGYNDTVFGTVVTEVTHYTHSICVGPLCLHDSEMGWAEGTSLAKREDTPEVNFDNLTRCFLELVREEYSQLREAIDGPWNLG